MEKTWSARLLITQLGSIVDYLDRMAQGNFRPEHLERLQAANDILKKCILQQKSVALDTLKPEVLGKANNIVSDQDCMKLSIALESITPCIKIEESRVQRITGALLDHHQINPANVRSNIIVLFETLKNRYNTPFDPTITESLQDSTLLTLEALYEVIRRLLLQPLAGK